MLQHQIFRFIVVMLALFPCAFAQGQEEFTVRLSWVPISGAERNDVSGSGTASATLSGSVLSIHGLFEGLPAAATFARLHQGVATGARGPVITELDVSPGIEGDMSGDVTLNQAQISALQAGHLYIQVHAERGVAPDNAVLWGWMINNRFLQE